MLYYNDVFKERIKNYTNQVDELIFKGLKTNYDYLVSYESTKSSSLDFSMTITVTYDFTNDSSLERVKYINLKEMRNLLKENNINYNELTFDEFKKEINLKLASPLNER